MALINEYIAELEASLAALRPVLEGFRDLRRTLLQTDGPEAAAETDEAIRDYEQREQRLESSLYHAKELAGNGYPTKVPVVMGPVAAGVIAEQVRTQTLALAQIVSVPEAQSADIVVEDIVP